MVWNEPEWHGMQWYCMCVWVWRILGNDRRFITMVTMVKAGENLQKTMRKATPALDRWLLWQFGKQVLTSITAEAIFFLILVRHVPHKSEDRYHVSRVWARIKYGEDVRGPLATWRFKQIGWFHLIFHLIFLCFSDLFEAPSFPPLGRSTNFTGPVASANCWHQGWQRDDPRPRVNWRALPRHGHLNQLCMLSCSPLGEIQLELSMSMISMKLTEWDATDATASKKTLSMQWICEWNPFSLRKSGNVTETLWNHNSISTYITIKQQISLDAGVVSKIQKGRLQKRTSTGETPWRCCPVDTCSARRWRVFFTPEWGDVLIEMVFKHAVYDIGGWWWVMNWCLEEICTVWCDGWLFVRGIGRF